MVKLPRIAVHLLCLLAAYSDAGPVRSRRVHFSPALHFANETEAIMSTEDELRTFTFRNLSSSVQFSSPNYDPRFAARRVCLDGTRRHRPGSMYTRSDDPCVQCICGRSGERCYSKTCGAIPDSCIEVRRDLGHCCVTCVTEGCSYNNQTYHVGETIQVTPCRSCKCETDGLVYCSVADCEPPKCVDFVRKPGECCPSCPNGTNCLAMGVKIPTGHVAFIPQRCMQCRCLQAAFGEQYWLGNKQAKCVVLERCRLNASRRIRFRRSTNDYPHFSEKRTRSRYV